MDKSDLELNTKIPKDKLVNNICDFYWDMGHKKIRLARETADDIIFEDYDPLVKIDNVYRISKISVHTYNKKDNKHVFLDSVNITFADEGATTKIMWYVGLGFKEWHLLGLVYLLIVFLASTYFAWIICPADSPWHRYCFTLAFPSFLFVFIWPMYYIIFKRKGKKLNSHPDTQKYKKDFEEFIRKKEKELLSERY